MRIKLDRKTVDRLKAPHPSGKQTLIWDSDLKGFGVLLSGKTQSKTFICQRDLPGGKTRRVTIGSVAEIDLAKAREEARDVLHAMRKGEDPKRKATDPTLRETLEAYLTQRTDLRPRSAASYRSNIERHLASWLDRPLREITREDVEERHKKIAASIARGGRGNGHATANAAIRDFRIMWNAAADRVSMPPCPVRLGRKSAGQKWLPVEPRTRHVKGDDLPRFFEAVTRLPNPVQRDYLLLLLFTGMRREEAAMLEWAHVDFAGGVIRVPGSSTKSGRKLDLPMTTFVRDLLVARRSVGTGTFVFPADGRRGRIAEPKYPLRLVENAIGLHVSVHDLRRTYGTVAVAAGISPFFLKGLMNHALPKDVTGNYIQMNEEMLREPAQKVCDKLMALCQAPAPVGENVVRIG